MALRISRQELVQLIRETRFLYRNEVGRKNRSKIINRIVSISGMSRKWVIRLLSGAEEIQNRMRGAPEKLTGSDVLLLKELWLFLNQPGAEYLHRMLPELLREYIPPVEPIRQVERPGYICVDTVTNRGTTRAGSFVCTLTWTDVYSGFTIHVAGWNHSLEAVKRALYSV